MKISKILNIYTVCSGYQPVEVELAVFRFRQSQLSLQRPLTSSIA